MNNLTVLITQKSVLTVYINLLSRKNVKNLFVIHLKYTFVSFIGYCILIVN